MAKHLAPEETGARLTAVVAALAALETFDPASIEVAVRAVAEAQGVKAGTLIHALRVSLTGKTVSPGLFEVASLLGRERAREDLLLGGRLGLRGRSSTRVGGASGRVDQRGGLGGGLRRGDGGGRRCGGLCARTRGREREERAPEPVRSLRVCDVAHGRVLTCGAWAEGPVIVEVEDGVFRGCDARDGRVVSCGPPGEGVVPVFDGAIFRACR